MRYSDSMKQTILSNEIKWLVAPDTEFADFSASEVSRLVDVPMPSAIGHSSIKSIHLPLNVIVYSGSHRFTSIIPGKLIPYARFKASYEEPVLMIHALKTGRAVMTDANLGDSPYGAAAGALFHNVIEIDKTVLLDLSENIDFTALGLGCSVLQGLLGEAAARRMLQILGLTDVPSSCVAKIPRHITAILHACLPTHLTGNIGVLYAQAKILEFFCELAGWLENLSPPPKLKSSDQEALLRLHEELSALEGKVPALNELSRRYGRSEKVLNQGFRELFGCSIFTYISEQRLAQAHEALLTTDAPMKAIAMNLGYSHVNNFITAFRKKYGYPPGSLRK